MVKSFPKSLIRFPKGNSKKKRAISHGAGTVPSTSKCLPTSQPRTPPRPETTPRETASPIKYNNIAGLDPGLLRKDRNPVSQKATPTVNTPTDSLKAALG